MEGDLRAGDRGAKASNFRTVLRERSRWNRRFINAPNQSDGYTELYFRNRLDLTVEAIVIDNPRWHPLFTPEEIEKAEARLKANKYTLGSAAE